ncbi:uncharacterized protein BDR25DRAFT_257397 [Lindgomyces ingoldianus]|uniref:Uncharacterized protein n=1 Tax=Lindgomyces ingoldianus TaxID=673940 RepID=A0ACB6R202_9PLEO|nr:uncharacterized protein BDR25DRAFT_257397 [Lindgomyces ingoldianus]KAF2473171.1 hypothetical protein BDR25DRAFT_257397 [Lindgomyces ingoldianus]
MDGPPPQRWSREKWVTVFSSHQPTIREVTECLGLGLCASSYNSNRGIPKFDEPNYQKLSNEVAKLSKELPQERDALLDFAADPESLNGELDELLDSLGTLIWGRDANRSRLLKPDASKKTYFKDLFVEETEDRNILKIHLHRWIVIKACYYIRNIRLKRKSGVEDGSAPIDSDREGYAILSPKPQLLVKNHDGSPQPTLPAISESPRTRRTSRLLASNAAQQPNAPTNLEPAETEPKAVLGSNATPPPPFTPINPGNPENGQEQHVTETNATAQPITLKPPASSTPTLPADALQLAEESRRTSSIPESAPSCEGNNAVIPSGLISGKKRPNPNGFDAAPRKASRPSLATASPSTENAPPLPGQVNHQPSPVTLVTHIDAGGRPMLSPLSSNALNGVARPANSSDSPSTAPPTFTAVNAPNGHFAHHTSAPSSAHSTQAQNGFASPYAAIAPNPNGPPIPYRTHTPGGTNGHNIPQMPTGPHALSRSHTPNGTHAQHNTHSLNRENSGETMVPATADLELMKFELLDSLMKYLHPKTGAQFNERGLFQMLELIWRHNTPIFQAQMGHLYTYQGNVLLAWIDERRKIAQLRQAMEIQPGVRAPEMVDRLLAMNDLRVIHLKWKALKTQVGSQTLSPEDLLCKTFAMMTQTEGTEHLFRAGLDRLNEGLFEFLRSDDMKISMNLR